MFKSVAVAAALACAFTTDADARPRHRHHHMHRALAWCGIYMSSYFRKSDRRLALARQWAGEGSNAAGPGIGGVVVWPHHVGVITGRTSDGVGSFTVATTAARYAHGRARLPVLSRFAVFKAQ